ncbi:unnamed protein product [Ambrosiozyma monospora]|uniref:Unnamed protein product n=1 Tax=Ambrosiozyma monospora TaxID=43982 RepID=A0ACB5TVN0_AMBMO|nr:unnamed protein product [Ambrosiozyma monospora]
MEKRPKVFKSDAQELLCIMTLTFAPACVSMSMGAYTVSINDTIEDLNIKGSLSTWLVGAISLANGATLILMGSLADSLGRRNCILLGYFAYAMFSLIGGFMQSLVSLCVLRALSGVLISLALTSSFGFVGATYVEGSKRKNRFNAVISAGNPLGNVVGNICGAICVQFIGSWRDCHYFYAILYTMLTILAWYCIPNDKEFNWEELKKTLKELDYVGGFLSLAGFALICFSLTQVDVTERRWHTPYIIALLVVGIVLVIAMLIWESYVPKRPLIPMRIWKNTNFTLCAIIMFFDWVAFTGMFTYYTVLYLEQILKNTPILTAAKM